MTRNKKIAVTALYMFLLLCLYAAIFTFSDQDGEESGSLSRQLSGKCTEVLEDISGEEWDSVKEERVAAEIEDPLRKLAHFTEYAGVGLLVCLICRLWLDKRQLCSRIPVVWVLFSAILDEWHQSFVPGRNADFADVCLDTLGGAVGVLFALGIIKIKDHFRRV